MMQVAILCVLLALPFTIEAQPDFKAGTTDQLTTPSLIASHGYPLEEHKVTTSDGYILTMHRIPCSPKNGNNSTPRQVAFLMHGMLDSSSGWVVPGPGKALAYFLSDNGFDVWMGNARGNFYSRKHISKKPLFNSFWNFEWHEIGLYDLPAMINYTLLHTKRNQLRYFGHSQGTTTFLLLNSIDTQLKNSIRSAHLLAPVAYMEHMDSPLAKLAGPLLGQPNPLSELTSVEFLPKTELLEKLGSLLCSQKSLTQELCNNVLFLIFGWDSPYLDKSLVSTIVASVPAGSSLNQVLHYLQLYISGEFRQLDYGRLRNLAKYFSWSPPKYNLRNIDVPLFMYCSENDYFASITDVKRLRDELNASTVKRFYIMPQKKWNHIDFLWGINATEFLYKHFLTDFENS